MKNMISFILFLIAPTILFADFNEDFESIKNNGRNLEDKGAICEEIAQQEFQKKYPNSLVFNGISYSGKNGSIGELDIVVMDKYSKSVFLIAEVKCWSNLRDGLEKAREQRDRFLKHVNSSREIQFHYNKDRDFKFTKQNFRAVRDFLSMGQKGAKAKGFDLELKYDLTELMKMRTEIMKCQYQGTCAPAGR